MENILNIENNGRGFVILFAVTLSALILSVALGVSNIAYRELKFSANARDANDAFLAANTGAECALFFETENNQLFKEVPDEGVSQTCNDQDIELDPDPESNIWKFTVFGLGSTGKGCASVRVSKTPSITTIISKGYNYEGGGTNCGPNPGTEEVERQVDVNYAS